MGSGPPLLRKARLRKAGGERECRVLDRGNVPAELLQTAPRTTASLLDSTLFRSVSFATPPGSQSVDRLLHFAVAAVTALCGVRRRGQQFVVQERGCLLQVRRIKFRKRLAHRLGPFDPPAQAGELFQGGVGSATAVEQAVDLVHDFPQHAEFGQTARDAFQRAMTRPGARKRARSIDTSAKGGRHENAVDGTKWNSFKGVAKSTLSRFSGNEVKFVPVDCLEFRSDAVIFILFDLSSENVKRGHQSILGIPPSFVAGTFSRTDSTSSNAPLNQVLITGMDVPD